MAREFKKYVANTDFKMAPGSPLGEKVYRGTIFEFDGLTVRSEDGQTGMIPFIKGAIQKGWVVPAEIFQEEDMSYVAPVAAPMGMGPSQHMGNSTAPRVRTPLTVVAEDSREALVVRDRTQRVQSINDSRHTARRVTAEAGSYATAADGQVVRAVSTPTHMSSRVTPDSVGSEISRFENQVRIQPQVASAIRSPRAMPVVSGDDNPEIAIRAPVTRSQTKNGYQEIEGIQFRQQGAANPPSSAPSLSSTPLSPSEAALRLRMAQAACPDFPDNYDFGLPEKKKLARMVADFEDRPDVIRAIWMAETDTFKAAIAHSFPGAFSS